MGKHEGRSLDPDTQFAYHSEQFTQFVADSYAYTKSGDPNDFYTWMDEAYRSSGVPVPGQTEPSLEKALAAERDSFAKITNLDERVQREFELSAWAHKMVKKTITKFSLTRGFEFAYVVADNERQCFLQSTLIAGLLQSMGVNAGVAMVYDNTEGVKINLGHCVTLLQMSDGQDRIVDASHPGTYIKDLGLFVRTKDYEFVDPVYVLVSPTIKQFTSVKTKRKLDPTSVRPLDVTYMRSMFWYYRGERAPGGILESHPTAKGLAMSERAYVESHRICPANPLTTYMLARTYLAEKKMDLAKSTFAKAHSEYVRYGWVPPGTADYFASHQKAARRGKHG